MSIIEAGISGALQGLFFASVILIPKFISNKITLQKQLKQCSISNFESSEEIFTYKGKSYSFVDFLSCRAGLYSSYSEKALNSALPKHYPPKFKNPINEIDYLAINAIIYQRKENLDFVDAVDYVIENKDHFFTSTKKSTLIFDNSDNKQSNYVSNEQRKLARIKTAYEEEKHLYCRNCGHKLTEDSNFCEKCGIAIKSANETSYINVPSPPSNPLTQRKSNPFIKIIDFLRSKPLFFYAKIIIPVAVVVAILISVVTSFNNTNDKITTTTQTTKHVYLPYEPQSGYILEGKEYFNGSELTIHASGGESCVVKLKTPQGITMISFYVRAGDTVTVGVPARKMYVYFASGDTWYGSDSLFGEETSYSKDSKLCNFEDYTWEYTLYSVNNGNFSETPIDADEF